MSETDSLRSAVERLIQQWRDRSNERHGTFHLHSERAIAAMRRCADELESALAVVRAPQPEQEEQ